VCAISDNASVWGDVPTWIGVVGGLGALVAAAIAGRAAWAVLGVERERG
jgi:hypothetical protein